MKLGTTSSFECQGLGWFSGMVKPDVRRWTANILEAVLGWSWAGCYLGISLRSVRAEALLYQIGAPVFIRCVLP